MRWSILLALAGLWLCLRGSPARADIAEDAVRFFCGPGHAAETALVRRESAHHHIQSTQLALVMAAESRCKADAINVTSGAAGLFGIIPGRSADPDHLDAGELLDPATNAHLGAAHLARMVQLCGSFAGALHLYHSRDGRCRNWSTDKHVAKLLRMERAFWRWMSRSGSRLS
jgi:hypothetical protein